MANGKNAMKPRQLLLLLVLLLMLAAAAAAAAAAADAAAVAMGPYEGWCYVTSFLRLGFRL
eukprot:264391-Karenia_brevis.AAC.1